MSNRTLNLDESLYEYLLSASLREPPVLKRLREQTAKAAMANMQIAPEQGQFMQLLIKLMGAKRTIEIGVFTGYSSLCTALALPDDGEIVCCDISEKWTSIAADFWLKAGVSHKVKLYLAPAQETLENLLAAGEYESFDFAFIDADKSSYWRYYELCLQLLRPGGVIAVDNVLWDGKVINESANDADTLAIRQFNLQLKADTRVDISLLPIADGLTLARKK